MSLPVRPRLRHVEAVPVGPKEDLLLALNDPDGFGRSIVLPYGAVVLAGLMNGQRTWAQLRTEFRARTGVTAARADIEAIVRRLDEAWLLDGQRFHEYRRQQIDAYLRNPVRPAWHAGQIYHDDPAELRQQLDALFTAEGGPGPVFRSADPAVVSNGKPLRGIISPHIDLGRGGAVFAWAYKKLAEQSEAELFVIFGTAHSYIHQHFCISRKDFQTPLGTVRTDQAFIDRLAEDLASSVAGRRLDLFADELAHRVEHSIEFQVVLLQHLLGGRRDFRIVPILVGSFRDFLASGHRPACAPEIQCFLAALAAAADAQPGGVCYISGADFAHVGQRFGDPWLLDEARLAAQAEDDRRLLELACDGDGSGFFQHVADSGDRSRICGLAPTYIMLEALGGPRGELLKYDQAVEPDGTACVSFASAAFYGEP